MAAPELIPFEDTFDGLYGLVIDEVTEERVRAHVDIERHHKQALGLVHGGLYAAMAESTTSMATARGVYADGNSAQGLSNQTSFLRPIFDGTVHLEARRRHRGRTTWVWEVDLTDDEGRLCAVVRMTIAVRPLPSTATT